MLTKMLVPLDNTEIAEGILPYVTQIAKGMNMPLLLLSVIDPDAIELPETLEARPAAVHATFVESGGPGGTTSVSSMETRPSAVDVHPHERGGPHVSQIFDRVEEETKRRLTHLVNELKEKGVAPEFKVVFGRPAEQIIKVAEEESCDLIAMSTHGRNALGRGILGSVTDNVIHHINIPVLTITPERAKDFWQEGAAISRILVPLDGSEMSETVLPYVESLAKALSLDITLVRTVSFDGFYSVHAGGYYYPGSVDIEAQVEADAQDYLTGVGEGLREKGFKVEWKLLRGDAARMMLELARETPQSLIALTTHGRSGFTRWVLGSVAEKLVRASGDPVLVVPPPSEED